MSKSNPRVRCFVCDSLVEREINPNNLKTPYALIPLHIANKRGCICSDCVNYHSNLDEEKTIKAFKSRQAKKSTLSEGEKLKLKYRALNYSIDSLANIVKRRVFGQDEIIERVIYTLYLNQMSNLYSEMGEKPVKPKHILLIGNSGVGKTLLASTVAKVLGIPYSISNATSITSAGYIGDKVENILERLYYAAGKDIELAENGIVIIDEIDKKVVNKDRSGRDIVGESVQQELLKLLEPSTVYINIDKQNIPFHTGNITIIMLGACIGLDDIIKKRLKPTSIGFTTEEKEIEPQKEKILPDDLINFGFIPEFVGRSPVVRRLNTLSHTAIVDIIYSLLANYNRFFKDRGFDLYVDPILIDKIAFIAIESKTGARDIEARIDELLAPALSMVFQSHSDGICEIKEDGSTEIIRHPGKSPLDKVELIKIAGDPLYQECID